MPSTTTAAASKGILPVVPGLTVTTCPPTLDAAHGPARFENLKEEPGAVGLVGPCLLLQPHLAEARTAH